MTITITPETPRTKILVGGLILSAPKPFAVGHVLTENEAAALNQTYLENIGNNFRTHVIAASRKAIVGKDEPTAEELKAVTDDQLKAFREALEGEDNQKKLPVDDLQTKLDALVAGYQMGVRRTSSAEVLSPEEREARSIAKDKIKAALVQKGIKLNTVSADWWDREIGKLLEHPEHGPKIKQNAARAVKLRQQAAGEAFEDLDMSDIAKAPKVAETAPATETATA